MKKNFSVTKICIIAMSFMVLVSAMAFITGAKNNTDTPYSYNLNGSDNFKTDFRTKEDDSSCYMKCETATGAYEAFVASGTRDSHAYDVSRGHHYRFVQGNARFMYNYVIESGFDIAAIFATPNNNGTVAKGKWSPDSVWQAGVIPASDYIK